MMNGFVISDIPYLNCSEYIFVIGFNEFMGRALAFLTIQSQRDLFPIGIFMEALTQACIPPQDPRSILESETT